VGEFKKVRLACSHGPDLHFEGQTIGEYSTQNVAGSKDRWTELRLWETPAGNWIAESVGCSKRHGEGEIRDAKVIDSMMDPTEVRNRQADGLVTDAVLARRNQVMDHFQWTTAAKAFARAMGWDVIRRVD
jgi:hypothetical protein